MNKQKWNYIQASKTQTWIVVGILAFLLFGMHEKGLQYGMDLYSGKIALLSVALIGAVIYLVKLYKNEKEEGGYPNYPVYPSNWDEIRKRILNRDAFTCINCGATNTIFHVHHVVPLSSGRGTSKDSNLVTLCEDCHTAIHPHMH